MKNIIVSCCCYRHLITVVAFSIKIIGRSAVVKPSISSLVSTLIYHSQAFIEEGLGENIREHLEFKDRTFRDCLSLILLTKQKTYPSKCKRNQLKKKIPFSFLILFETIWDIFNNVRIISIVDYSLSKPYKYFFQYLINFYSFR